MSIKNINVIRWINYEKSENYIIQLFEDDNIEDGISKIAMTINKNSRFYVWINNLPNIYYSIENIKWKGYNNNPLKSTDRNNPIIKQPIIYKFNYGLCYFNKINIIFENDFNDLKNNQYYFIDKNFKSLDELKKRENKLINLTKVENKISENRTNIHRYELSSKLTTYNFLADIFDKLNTNNSIQYIQWINDNYTLIHKLYMYHSISPNNLKNWANIDKITNARCINCFMPLASSSTSYIKITINNDMTININFVLDLRKNFIYDDIETILNSTIIKYLETSLETKIKLTPISIKLYNYVSISNVTLEKLAKVISSYQDIFKSISFKKSINLIYKRSSNYTNDVFDINIYVKNRLILGVNIQEIIDELLTFNITEDEANKIIAQEIDLLNELDQQKIKAELVDQRINTLVIIKQSKSGFEIIVHNIPNKKEMDYLIFWLSKIISSSQEKIKEIKTKPIMIKKESSSSSSIQQEDEEEDLGKLSFSSSGGGAKNDEKENQRYKITLLQNTDKDLFGENYARDKCQKKNQPFVITKENREKLIQQNKYYVDNELYYGSKKDNMNYYICPRFWCKVSKVPADPITGICPIEGEDKIESFFLKPGEEGIKRYVQLIKPNENNICAPCCFKKPPKENDLGKCKNYENYDPKNIKNIDIDEKDENYLVNASAPINVGRFGVVPKQLHELLELNPNPKGDKILVRKGIIHKITSKEENIHTDSLIFALAYLLNFKNKKAFIDDLIKKIDLITFLSIENGNVCKAFMDNLPIIPSQNIDLINELKKTFPNLKKIYDINYLSFDYKLSRLLAIFKSYKKFINYLSSNDYSNPKSSYYLYALISIIYNKLLVIWEKSQEISILCPYYTSYNDLITIMEINPEIIMLLKEGKYYEPLEIKYKNKDINKIFKLNDYSNLKELLKTCSNINDNNYEIYNQIYQNLYTLNSWIKTKVIFNNYTKFVFKTILINSDLTIEHFLTNEGILITIDKIGISFLPRIMKDLEITNIAFYDDYINIPININILIKDLEIFKEKVKSLNIKYDVGSLDKSIIQPPNEIYTILELPSKELSNSNIIHARIEDDLYLYDTDNYEENKKWFQLQIMVYKTLLKNLNEEKLQKLLSLPRIEYINQILTFFAKNPNKNKIRVIIEEIPIYSIMYIKNYLNKIIMYNKYDFLNPNIIYDNKRKQFLFSQVALKDNIIPHQLINYHKSAPNSIFQKAEEKNFNFIIDLNKNEDLTKLPKLMKGEFEPLNSKWVMHKKSTWYLMQILKIPNYKDEYFKEFYEWFANFINIKASYKDLINITIQKLRDYKNNEGIMKTLFKDKALFNSYVKESGKNFTNINIYWDKYYNNLTNKEKLAIIEEIAKKEFIINDLTILTMSEILNISILTIHRAIYGSINPEDIRGDLEDLIVSSTFCKAPNNYQNRPLLIFFKLSKDDITKYNLVFDKRIIPVNTKSFYLKFNELPDSVKILIDEHLRLDKDKIIPLLK